MAGKACRLFLPITCFSPPIGGLTGILESHDTFSASLIAFCGVSDIHLETCFMDGQIEFSINLTERPAGLPANQDVFINS